MIEEDFLTAKQLGDFPPDPELENVIERWLESSDDDVKTMIATAFYAGMLFQSKEQDDAVDISISPEDAYNLTRQLHISSEVLIKLYVEE